MFEENLEIIKNCFLEYKGTGAYVSLYCLALFYLFLKEDDKQKRAFTIYFPFFVLLVIMNPIFNKMVGSILKKSTYWRVFWLIPMGITLSYACAKYVCSLDKNIKKILVSICLMLIIALGGKYMYSPGNFLKIGNLYKIPDEAAYVTQLIGADNATYKKALVSYYLVPYIRQIDASIDLAYPRSATPYTENSLAILLGKGEVDKITAKAKSTKSNYIVMHKETPVTGEFEEYGYELLHETDEYRIYKLIEEEN